MIAQLKKYEKQMKQHTSLSHMLGQHKIIQLQDLHAEVKFHRSQIQKMNQDELTELVKQKTAFELGNAICNNYQLKFSEEEGIEGNEGMIRFRTKITIIEP